MFFSEKGTLCQFFSKCVFCPSVFLLYGISHFYCAYLSLNSCYRCYIYVVYIEIEVDEIKL